jgi:hypothetical protein
MLLISLFPIPGFGQVLDITEQSFTRPEDAVVWFIDAVKEQNLAKALEACAVFQYGRDFDFKAMYDRLQALTFFSLAPAEYEMYAELNQIQQSAQLVNQLKYYIYAFLAPEVDFTMTQVAPDAKWLDRLVRDLDPSRLAGLEVIEMGLPMPSIFNTQRNLENMRKRAAPFGADTSTELVVLYRFEKKYYYSGFSFLRYGDYWKIDSLASYIAGTGVIGGVEETTFAEFGNLIER